MYDILVYIVFSPYILYNIVYDASAEAKIKIENTAIIYYCRLHGPEGRSPTFGHVNLGFGEDSQSSG